MVQKKLLPWSCQEDCNEKVQGLQAAGVSNFLRDKRVNDLHLRSVGLDVTTLEYLKVNAGSG